MFAVIGLGASIGAIVGAFVPHLLQRDARHPRPDADRGRRPRALDRPVPDRRSPRARAQGQGQAEKLAQKEKQKQAAAADGDDKRGGFSLVIRDRYLRLLAMMLLVATIINTTGEYVIGKMATDRGKTYAARASRKAGRARRRSTRRGTESRHGEGSEGRDVASGPAAARTPRTRTSARSTPTTTGS